MRFSLLVSFVLAGYLSGSVLYADLFSHFLLHKNIRTAQPDHNPGVASAFLEGGLLCGIPTLICDLAKGGIPVWWALRCLPPDSPAFALVLLAPVAGHAWPLFYHFRGGKSITVSFGVLLGLWPAYPLPAWILAISYLFFSLVLHIGPHALRSIAAFFCAWAAMVLLVSTVSFTFGFGLIALVVIYKHWADLCRRDRKPAVETGSSSGS